MKILVLSDSHSALSFMRLAIRAVRPDAVIHLGDHNEDAVAMVESHPQIPFHMVPGNCDRFRCDPTAPLTMCYDICGVRLYMTHGHMQAVKTNLLRLMAEARAYRAQAALYGHTHQGDCRIVDGMWVLNPGTCGSFGGSVGLIETEHNEIKTCRILRQAEQEALL